MTAVISVSTSIYGDKNRGNGDVASGLAKQVFAFRAKDECEGSGITGALAYDRHSQYIIRY